MGETRQAIENMKLFSKQDDYFYWIVLFLDNDPLIDNNKDFPEFKKIITIIEDKF